MSIADLEIYLFRHGETEWNRKGLMQGHTDIELNSVGIEQASTIIPKLLDKKIEFIYSSDLKRAKRTGEIVAQGLGLNISFHKELREANFGIAEGKKITENLETYGELFWELGNLNTPDFYYFSYPKGESRHELQTRLINFLNIVTLNSPYKKIALSIHGGALRYLVLALTQNSMSNIPIPNSVVYKYLNGNISEVIT